MFENERFSGILFFALRQNSMWNFMGRSALLLSKK
jgi:hypothetical protein